MYHHLPKVGSLPAPRLTYRPSPNRSGRHGRHPQIVFEHRWGSLAYSFDGVVNDLSRRGADKSAHFVYAGIGHAKPKDRGRAAQLVPLGEKAWTECDLNAIGISIETADAVWLGLDPEGFAQLARMTALLLHQQHIPVRWVRGAAIVHGGRGHARHADGGHLACGHFSCPTEDLHLYEQFHERVLAETNHGKFRQTRYGR